ncbi:MAG TPA: DUF5060 domain-containing protein [Bryobacteraceae bacterium]|nr:DUF5060 domain-containing protein [Bryobacteraceae bacterium]
MPFLLLVLFAAPRLFAQPQGCSSTPAWSPCDMVFDLASGENPETFELRGEFRSPHHKTYRLIAFRDSGPSFILRFTPTEAGDWEYRLSSNLPRLEGMEGKISASPADLPGFVRPAPNFHHFQTDNGQPHLWMAAALDNFVRMPRADFDQQVDQRAKEKFTHLRVTLDREADLREAADRVRAINSRGLVADLVLASIPEDAVARRKYMADIAGRFAAFNIIWMGVPAFENLPTGRAILKDAGALLKQYDGYDHPRTSLAESSSAPLASDQWETVLSYGTVDPNVGAVEHQLYGLPQLNTAVRSQRDLWNATMNGQYPASGAGPYMTAWFDFMSGNRYWELEPYFDVDGGRALALEGVEYIVYVEKPGPVEVTLINHGYDVAWINPATGERIKAKDYKGQHFTGEPPDRQHDWILHISRESHKQSMLKSYRFDSRSYDDPDVPPAQLQQIERDPQKTPFDVETPVEGSVISLAMPPLFSLKITRQTRATRSLLVEWTGEVTADGEGFRVIGTGRQGTFQIPRSLVRNLPAALRVRLSVLNANGKVYELDKVYRLTQ